VYFQKAVASGPGTIIRLNAYLGGYTGQVQVGVYSDNSGQPGSLLRSSAVTTLPATGWRTIDIPDLAIAGPATYWLAIECDSTQFVSLSETAGSAYRVTNSFGSLPSTASGLGAFSSTYSLYADYCLPVGWPTDTPTSTYTVTSTPSPTSTFTATDTPACLSPQSFGDRTVYSGYSIPSAYVYFMKAVSSGPGTVMNLSVYLGGYTGLIQVGLYDDNGGQPGNRLSASSPTLVPASGWRTVDIPDVVLSGATTLWLAVECDNTQFVNIATTSGSAYRVSNSFGTFPASVTAPTAWSSTYSLYANYCRPPGALTDTPTPTSTPTPTATITNTPTSTDTPACANPTPVGDTNTYGGYSIPVAYIFFQKDVVSGPGTIMNMAAYLGGYSGLLQAGIYDDNAGQPGNRLSVSSPTFVAASGWRTVDVPDVAVPSGPTTFWLAVECDNTQYVNISATTGSAYRLLNSFGTFPASVTSPGSWSSTYSLYVNRCP
jgi:hypothetical protein